MVNFSEVEHNIIMQCDGVYVRCDASKIGFNYIYPFTTENINGYATIFDLKNKSLLTTGSSADQAINANYYGCNDITIIDVNSYSRFYYFLKHAALMTLDYNEFLEFFRYNMYPSTFKNNKNVFNISSYEKLKSYLRLLDYESFLIWDELFNTHFPIDIRKNLFETDEENTNEITNFNAYLKDEESYLNERKRIKNLDIKFMTGDLSEINIKEVYDNIWLSNIGCYYEIEDFKKIVNKIKENLKENGKMLVCYLYTTKNDTKYKKEWDPIYNLAETFKIFKDYELSLVNFTGTKGIKFNDNDIKDAILLYEKKVTK